MKVFLTKTDLTDPKLMNNSVYENSWYRKESWIVLLSEINSVHVWSHQALFTEESWVSGWGLESGFGSLGDLSHCCHSKVVYQLGNVMSSLSCDLWRGIARKGERACVFGSLLFSIQACVKIRNLLLLEYLCLSWNIFLWIESSCLMSGRDSWYFVHYGKPEMEF